MADGKNIEIKIAGPGGDQAAAVAAILVEGKAVRHPVNESKAIIAKGDHMVVIQRKDKRHGWVVTGLEDPKTIGKLKPLKK